MEALQKFDVAEGKARCAGHHIEPNCREQKSERDHNGRFSRCVATHTNEGAESD